MSFIAVDIGATNIRVATGDQNGLQQKVMEPTEIKVGPKRVSNQIIRLIESIKETELISIGIGSIGPIDLKKGMITNTPNYSFNNIPITEPLNHKYNIPVTIVNDCAAAVIGEQTFGEGKGLHNLAYVTISTGLGGGVIVDNHLLLGKDGNAAEVGHFTIDPNSEIICGCGCRGHWEAFCGGMNISKFAKILLKEHELGTIEQNQLLCDEYENFTVVEIFKGAKLKDKYAQLIVEKIGQINAIGFANIVNAYDPELITIGGSIALNNPELILKPILKNIQKHTINRIPEIKITKLGQDAVLLGALALSMNL